MSEEINESVSKTAHDFLELVKKLISEKSYNEISILFNEENNVAADKRALLQEIQEDLLNDICLKYLTKRTHEEDFELYNCVDEILKRVATYAPTKDLLIRLLEMVEELHTDYQLTTTLRALQALLLNLTDEKAKALDWALNTLQCCMQQLKLPEHISECYDEDQSKLLEQDCIVEEILGRYITVGLFYGALKDDILKQKRQEQQRIMKFRDCSSKNLRNLLCCFLVQLLGKPLALLDLTVTDERKTNLYTMQIVRKLTRDVTELIIDPFYFLTLVEQHSRWKRRLDASKGVYELSSKNIFLISERLPLVGLGIYYYMLFVDSTLNNEVQKMIPKVYAPGFIVESNLYLVNTLLMQNESSCQLRGVLLAKEVLTRYMDKRFIPSVSLELNVYKTFCELMCKVVGYAPNLQLRKESISVLRHYILLYDHEGRHLIIRNLVPSLEHMGLKSYLITLHKDIVSNAIISAANTLKDVPLECRGSHFRDMLLNVICNLPEGAKTDLLMHAEPISAALNVIRYYALCDSKNYTGFWNLQKELTQKFLEPLRQGLDYSIAHYKLEMNRVETNWDDKKEQEEHQKAMELINIDITNMKNEATIGLNRDSKLNILKEKLTTFDLLHSLWGRTQEVLEQRLRKYRIEEEKS